MLLSGFLFILSAWVPVAVPKSSPIISIFISDLREACICSRYESHYMNLVVLLVTEWSAFFPIQHDEHTRIAIATHSSHESAERAIVRYWGSFGESCNINFPACLKFPSGSVGVTVDGSHSNFLQDFQKPQWRFKSSTDCIHLTVLMNRYYVQDVISHSLVFGLLLSSGVLFKWT